MNLITIIIISCWILLGVYWIVGAFSQKETKKSLGLGSDVKNVILLLMSTFLLMLSTRIAYLNFIVIKYSIAVDIISLLLVITGLLICIYSRKVLGGNWSSNVEIKKNHELITNGPYGFVRHPIYSGIVMMYLGTAIAIGNLGGLIGCITIFFGFRIKAREEEKLMIAQFGKKYLDYRKRTKALIPYIF